MSFKTELGFNSFSFAHFRSSFALPFLPGAHSQEVLNLNELIFDTVMGCTIIFDILLLCHASKMYTIFVD